MNDNIRSHFPILSKRVHGHRLSYLDSAATTQKPQCVLDTLNHYYTQTNANIHRGVHHLSELATLAFENARQVVQRFIHAPRSEECIFVKGSTEAINLVASSFGDRFIAQEDEILISALEHHSNIVPWQQLCQRKGARLKVIPMNPEGELILDNLEQYFTPRTKLLAISHISNALGTLNPIKDIIARAHSYEIPVFIDGAQSAPHLNIDVQALDCDFFTFSGHKTYGPTGVGVLYGKTHWLDAMPPYQGGGDMILTVSFERSTYQEIPFKFEAGTPPIAEVLGLASALEYLSAIGWAEIKDHDQFLMRYATEQLATIPGLKIIGRPKHKIGSLSFILEGIHPHDIGSIVNEFGVAIRTGHHCAMPVMDFLGLPGTARASFGIYNTVEDIDQLIKALYEVKRVFKC